MKSPIIGFLLIAVSLFACNKKSDFISDYDLSIIPFEQNKLWGYIDKKGEILINPQFKTASLFYENIALVQTDDDKWGYINTEGKFIITPQYKQGSIFAEGIAIVVQENNHPQLIDTKGEVIKTLTDLEEVKPFINGYALVKKGSYWGMINKTGDIAIPTIYKSLGNYYEGLAAFSLKGNDDEEPKYGYINEKGIIIITPQFKYAGEFHDGLARVSNSELYGYIDKEGKYKINPQFKSGKDFSNGVAFVNNGDSWGMIDNKGQYLLNPQFKQVPKHKISDLIPAKSIDDKFGYVNEEGSFKINPQFESASSFYKDIAIVRTAGKWGIIDMEGSYIVNPQFDNILYPEITEYLFAFQSIKSDYFNTHQIADFLLNGTDKNMFFNINPQSTYKEISSNFKGDLNYKNLISYKNIEINEYVFIDEITFGFSENIKQQIPIYKTIQRYDSRKGGYYNEQVFDHYDNINNESAEFRGAIFKIELKDKAQDHANEIYTRLKDELITNTDLTINEERLGGEIAFLSMENNNYSIVINYVTKSPQYIEIRYYNKVANPGDTDL
ncbi:MAG: WG repeat-containing protein [Bacteroidetes bacterium]|nr:WG repeat-containing protein [Bacteroidota bacterium]